MMFGCLNEHVFDDTCVSSTHVLESLTEACFSPGDQLLYGGVAGGVSGAGMEDR